MFKDFDVFDFACFMFVLFCFVSGIIFAWFSVKDNSEKECVQYYVNNSGYVLEGCEKYSYKLSEVYGE